MRTSKSLLLVLVVVGVILSSCSSNAAVVSPTEITIALPTSVSTSTSTNTLLPTIDETKINLSAQLYLDENSSPDTLGEPNYPDYSYFWNDLGNGYVYRFENEEWVVAQPWTRIVPFKDVDTTSYVEGELRQDYVQLWKDKQLVYSLPVPFGDRPHTFLRYENHWIFSFGDDWDKQIWIVQDGIILNDLHDYDSAFSLFLLDDKPFFFFRRGDQFGVSFNNEEKLLPYPNISYDVVCCDNVGRGARNPRAGGTKVGFWVWWGDNEYQYDEYRYVEIGLRGRISARKNA